MDETEEKKATTEETKPSHKDGSATNQDDDTAESAEKGDASRMDRAKAWMRALHAGDDMEVVDGDQAVNLRQMESQGISSTQAELLETELLQAQQKAQEAEALYKRMAADFENFRRRTDREREEFQAAGVKKMAEAIFPALDDMDRALTSLNADSDPEKLMEGLNIICTRIMGCLEQAGIKPLESIGQEFDPRFHEPVQQIETTEFPDGVVMQELRRGYQLNDVVLRPSLVNVASNESQAVESKDSAESPPDADGIQVYELDDVEEDTGADVKEVSE